ncbi:hypothetical protein Adt_08191 [Abeliophyllum distichum]|uniref:Uncharacterized protein n=1 Tax=Abeliophyllum distichum TaxID=126358 RepID=A0ABD1VBW6_9LAMI
MVGRQQKQGLTSTYSPISEREHEGGDDDDVNDVVYEEAGSVGGCACFRLFCFGWNRENEEEKSHMLQGEKEPWLVKELKKLKEFSEVVAGPKWKNFIRKIGKLCNEKKSKTQFQYSPESYALNFACDDDHDDLVCSFPSRFAPQAFQRSTEKGCFLIITYK